METLTEYRKKLKLENAAITVCCGVLIIFFALSARAEAGQMPGFAAAAGDSRWQSAWHGFVAGASIGLLALLIIGLVRNARALTNEAALKKLYVKTHDERSIQIWTSARALSMQIFLLLGLVAIVVAGYFSATVSITLLCCVLAHSLIGLCCKLYYSKKF